MGLSLKGAIGGAGLGTILGGGMGGSLGGLMGGFGGLGGMFGGEQEQVTKNEPWSALQPYLKSYYGAGQDWFNAAKSPEEMVAGFSPEQQMGMGMISNRAMMGSPITGAAQREALNTLSGRSGQAAFNPLFDTAARKMGEKFRSITMPAIGARFGGVGRGGSGLEKEMYQGAMGNLATGLGDLAGNIYGRERQNQMQMMGMAPMISGMDYGDMQRLMGVGGMRQGLAQQRMDAPGQRLQQWGSLLQPGSGFGTQTQTMPRNPLGSAMGGAMMGGSLGGPWGALAGGGLGFLGGMGY